MSTFSALLLLISGHVVHPAVPADVPRGLRAGEGRDPQRRLLLAGPHRAAGRGLRAVRRAGPGVLPPAQLAVHAPLRDRHRRHPLDLDPLPAAEPSGPLAPPGLRRRRRLAGRSGVLLRQHHLHAADAGAVHAGVRPVRRHDRPHRMASRDRLHPRQRRCHRRSVRRLSGSVGADPQDQVQAGGPRPRASRAHRGRPDGRDDHRRHPSRDPRRRELGDPDRGGLGRHDRGAGHQRARRLLGVRRGLTRAGAGQCPARCAPADPAGARSRSWWSPCCRCSSTACC